MLKEYITNKKNVDTIVPFKVFLSCPSIFYDLPTGLETVDSDFDLPKCGMSIATAAIPLDPSSSKNE